MVRIMSPVFEGDWPRPVSDSRADKLAALPPGFLADDAHWVVKAVEQAALVLLDPDDPAMTDRVAEALAESACAQFIETMGAGKAWSDLSPGVRERCIASQQRSAADVISALKERS